MGGMGSCCGGQGGDGLVCVGGGDGNRGGGGSPRVWVGGGLGQGVPTGTEGLQA